MHVSPLSHLSFSKNVCSCLLILTAFKIINVAVAQHENSVSDQVDMIRTEILEIKWVPLIAAREIGVVYQTNNYQVQYIAGCKIVILIDVVFVAITSRHSPCIKISYIMYFMYQGFKFHVCIVIYL